MSGSGRGPRGRARTRLDVATPPVVASVPSSSIAAGLETGRGRGLGAQPEASELTPTGQPRHSPTESGQSDSPPQPQQSAGRAALRGKLPQLPGSIDTVIIDPMARLTLTEPGDVDERVKRQQLFFESVPFTRPETCTDKKGTSGVSIKLMANYFEILSKPNWVLHQYHVDFKPEIESRRMRAALLHNHDHLFPDNKAFDGSTLYSLTRLSQDMTDLVSPRREDNEPIHIKVKWITEIGPTSPNFVHLFNIVFRKCMTFFGMNQIGRNFYDMSTIYPIEQFGLNIVNGYSTAIGTFESKLMLCAEVCHRVINKKSVYDVMNEHYMRDEKNFRGDVTGALVGQTVMTRYNHKTYKVDDIDWNVNPKSTFKTSDGTEVSFVDYYLKNYNIRIREVEQPLLLSRPKAADKRRGITKPCYLIPELCDVTGISDEMRSDNFMMRELMKRTAVKPQSRYENLRNFITKLNSHEKVKEELNKWQMKFSPDLVSFDGRRLDTETLLFGGDKKKKLNEKADWTNDMKTQSPIAGVNLDRWVVIYSGREENDAYTFVETLAKITQPMGIRLEQPEMKRLNDDRVDSFVSALKETYKTLKNIQMIVFVLGSNRKDRYDAVKRFCCLDTAIPSQVILAKNLRDQRKTLGVMTKVAIQMNCKLGGEIWTVHIPITKIMICGIDTYHDSQKKGFSVCAFVATVNNMKTKFFSRATLQETHQELSNNLTLSVKSALEHYRNLNGELPEKIIIYRDGISDGQLPNVVDYEIPQISKSFELVQQQYNPRLACIIVKKRGNARFFETLNNGTNDNPLCGTVIDNTITRAEWFDFYLISQTVTQGTVNPTHYNVIFDNTGLKAEHFQRLSYKLCHMYYNWSGTIRVPALCQYAHKLAFLVGQSLHKEHNLTLSDKLFYL